MTSSKETIVITGVTRGIGNGMVKFYLSQGHTVIGCGRSEDKITELQENYKHANADFSVVDISKESEVINWSKRILQKFGAPTLLINCAGIINENNVFWEISGEEFDKVIDINIKGFANVLRHFIPAMIEAKRGNIVNFSSDDGRMPEKYISAYCSNKYGIEGMSQTIALELPEPLACVTIDPGIINTYMGGVYLTNRDDRKLEDQCPVEKWVKVGCPLFLGLTRADNGAIIDAPEIPEN